MDGRDPAGGSRVLAELIDDYGGEIAGDLAERYGKDLRDLFKPRTDLDPFWALVLVDQLPHHSAFKSAQSGTPEARDWTVDSYLLAGVINEARTQQYVTQVVNADKKYVSKIPTPEGVELPGSEKDRSAKNHENEFATTAAEIMANARSMKGG